MSLPTHSPAMILAELLIKEMFFTRLPTDVWPIFVGFMPSTPNDCAAVYDTDGLKDGRLMSGTNVFHYGIQLRVRSDVYDDGWIKVVAPQACLEALKGSLVSVDAETYEVTNMSQLGPPLFLGLEEGTTRRNLFTINYMATLKEN